ncbi:MAG: MerR family transcriptional regulator [Pseudomonadota bacterium]
MTRFRTAKQINRLTGVSAKALRLYEQRGLISPGRTTAGWRVYGPGDIAELHKIQTLKLLGFSLAEISQLLTDGVAIEKLLDAQEALLEEQQAKVSVALDAVRKAQSRLSSETGLSTDDLIALTKETLIMSEYEWTDVDQKLADRHYTKEQQDRLVKHKMSDAFQAEIDELWTGILEDIDRLKGGPADTPEALDVARRWLKASDIFHQGDTELNKASDAWYEDGYANPETEGNMPFPKDTWEFTKAAVAALEARGGTD